MQFRSKTGAIPGKDFDSEVAVKKPVVSAKVEEANKKRVADLKAGRKKKS